MEFDHFWNWFVKNKFPEAILLSENITLSWLVAPGSPRMFSYVHVYKVTTIKK